MGEQIYRDLNANCIILNVTKGVKTKGSLTHN